MLEPLKHVSTTRLLEVMSHDGTTSSARPQWARALFCALLPLCLAACKAKPKESPHESPPDAAAGAPPVATASAPANDVGGKPRGIGQVAHAPSYEMVVLGAKTCPPPAWHRVKAGYTRLGVEVEIRGKSTEPVPANPFYARLLDPEDKAYRPVFGGCDPDLRHKPLSSGDSVRAFITFEIPEATGRMRLRYEPQLKSLETLEFDLGTSPASVDSATP